MNKEVKVKEDVVKEVVVGTVGSISLLSTVQQPFGRVVSYHPGPKGFSFTGAIR